MFSQLPAVCTHCRMVAGVGVEPTKHASWHKPQCSRYRPAFPGEKIKKAQTFEELNAELAAIQPPEVVVAPPPPVPEEVVVVELPIPAPEVVPEVVPEVAPEVVPEVAPEVVPEVVPEQPSNPEPSPEQTV